MILGCDYYAYDYDCVATSSYPSRRRRRDGGDGDPARGTHISLCRAKLSLDYVFLLSPLLLSLDHHQRSFLFPLSSHPSPLATFHAHHHIPAPTPGGAIPNLCLVCFTSLSQLQPQRLITLRPPSSSSPLQIPLEPWTCPRHR